MQFNLLRWQVLLPRCLSLSLVFISLSRTQQPAEPAVYSLPSSERKHRTLMERQRKKGSKGLVPELKKNKRNNSGSHKRKLKGVELQALPASASRKLNSV